MVELFSEMFNQEFMPHGHCYFWTPGILWGHVISDMAIGIAYLSIPFGLIYFIKRRDDMVFSWVFVLFAIFILACGIGHLVDVWNIWNSDYGIATIIRIITAIVSVGTAGAVWAFMGKALRIPSADRLRAEVRERKRIEAEILEANRLLEERVEERTGELRHEKSTMQRIQDLLVDREHAMVALKEEVNSLREELGKPPRYSLKSVKDEP